MEPPNWSLLPSLTIPFRLRGSDGRVVVSFGVNRDAARWGFDHLASSFQPELAHGFPVCQAEIEFGGEGYCAMMGWIQLVSVEDREGGQPWSSVDTYTVFRAVDIPFVTFGVRPTPFDAPRPNPPRANERWTADSILAVCGDIVQTRHVSPVCGFRWGYDLAGGVPSPFSPVRSGKDDWKRAESVLVATFPSWEFSSDFVSERENG